MGERKKLGLIYLYTDNWIALGYYVLNIIKALNYLDDEQKPQIILLHSNNDGINLVENINYPYIEFYKFKHYNNKIFRGINFLTRKAFNINIIEDTNVKKLVETVYPSNWGTFRVKNNYNWIPDFQEQYYPEFFSKEELKKRKSRYLNYSKNHDSIVFSSVDSLNDYVRLYPNNNAPINVLPFASVLDHTFKSLDIDAILTKYKITKPYFFIPNQFWQHKNHKIVIEAVLLLKDKNLNFKIVFSGKENDYRNKEYVSELKRLIKENELNKYFIFLGFIDREEQLQIINHSLAVIQPSLFEGWSTVVEDAKAMNKYLILSDLPVHKEQIKENVVFFERKNKENLKEKIEKTLEINPKSSFLNYDENIIAFANNIIKIFCS